FGLVGTNCHIGHRVCLNAEDLAYVLITERQMGLKESRFLPLYPAITPSSNSAEQQQVFARLFEQILLHLDDDADDHPSSSSSDRGLKFDYHTERLHPILELLFSHLKPNTSDTIDDDSNEIHSGNFDLTNLNWNQSRVYQSDAVNRQCSDGNCGLILRLPTKL